MLRLKHTGFRLLFLVIGLASPASALPFVHPGGLHSQADLNRMKAKVSAGESPWIEDWNVLVEDPKAQSDYQPRPQRHMIDRGRAQRDASAAYLNGLRWSISGDKAHADCAVRILNAWSGTVNEVARGNDQPGLGGIPIGTFAIAAELMRGYPGWSAADQARFKRMLLHFMYPVCRDFLVHHNGRGDSAFWANWDTCNMRAIMAIGVFCDDRAKFDEAVEYFKNGRGMGSIRNAAPFRFEGGLVQWQESGRDYAHVMGGQGLLMEMCQIAWNQGLDLFGYDDNRLLGAAEHAAQYTLWKGVPYRYYTNCDDANQFYISENYHGRLDASHFELVYNHYVVQQGLKAPHIQLFAALRRPEPGEIDVLGYGTLTYTLDAAASPLQTEPPPVPREVIAIPGLQRVELKWSPSGAYSSHGYEVSRATAPGGPFTSIYSTTRWTTPSYVDTDVEPDRTYYYTIAALNNAGRSAPSAPVNAIPAEGESLPAVSRRISVAGVLYSKVAGNSFIVPASGRELDGSFAGQPVDGDFCMTARLVDWKGSVGMAGLTVREPGSNKPRAMAVTLGEVGGRLARFRTRVDGKTTVQRGCDYTWLPVWFRIRRVGDEFTACQSSYGIEWFEIGKSTVALPRTALVGLLASGGATPPGRKATDSPQGVFDHVSIERQPPPPPPAPGALATTALDGGVIRLDWKKPSLTSQSGVKVEASRDGAPFYEIADLAAGASRFENTGIKRSSALRYRVRAYNTGGYSAYSNVAAHAQGFPKAILPGDYPDPTILRDGSDYYMTHSPFFYTPGFLIWHSKDLVNWQPVARAMPEVVGDAYAPDLVKYEGKYYIYFPADGKNWVITATDIRGPWSKPKRLDVGRIDPGHAVGADGKRYLFLSGGGRVTLSEDGLSVRSRIEDVYKGWEFPHEWQTEGKWLESPKIFHRGDYFYMVCAQGGTAGPPTSHMAIVARSKSIDGPWENSPYNPLVHTYKADEPWWSKGHGTIIDDVNGNWWIVYHAYENGYYPLGRQTLLDPIDWTVDGWPVLAKAAHPLPPGGGAADAMKLSDDFSGKQLGLQWATWRDYDPKAITLKNNSLHLTARGETPADARLLLVTATNHAYEIEAEVTIEKGATGGLILFYSGKSYAGIVSDGKEFTIYKSATDVTKQPSACGSRFFLKIANRDHRCTFAASPDGMTWTPLATDVDVSQMHHNKFKGFLALRPGLVALGKGDVRFAHFRYTPLPATQP